MITTASDFEQAVKELTNDRPALSQTYNSEMSSDEHNKIFKDIENELNTMYEQLRILEDIKNYCKTTVIKTIDDEKVKLMDKLRIIEHASDSFSDTSCVAYEVKLETAPDIEVRDRNGDVLPTMRNVNGQLEVDGIDSRRAAIASVKCVAHDQCYSNTAQNLVNGGASRSLYVRNEPTSQGIVELYEIEFKEPVRCNYINIQAVNCDVENLQVSLNGKGVANLADSAEGYVDEVLIFGLRFSIRATNYDYRDVVIDTQNNNYFRLLDDNYYQRRNTSKNVESFVAGTDKKNTQRYINDFVAKAVETERGSND